MSNQPPKRTHSWKRAKSDTTLLKGRSFNEYDKKAKVPKTLKLRKGKRRDSSDDCDEEAKKFDCMPQEVAKDGRLMLEVRNGKKRLQVWKACRVQLVMSTSYAMNTFGKKQFILMCITGGLLGLSKRYLSVPLADIHAIYKGGKENGKQAAGQERLSFVLQTSDKQLHFRAANDSDMLDWVAEVKASLAVERANGFLPSIFHVRIGPDQQVPMTDALLAFHPHRNPEQLHIRQALSETTLYGCHIADILRFGYAHDGSLLWVEVQPRDSPLATEKILLLCPNNSRPDVVQALQCNLQSVLGGAGHTIQTSNEHQTIFSVRDRFAVGAGGAIRRRPLSVNLGAQSHQPRGAIRRHGQQASPFKHGRPLSQTDDPAGDDNDDGGGETSNDWRMDVKKHKEQLVKHMHRNLLRQRSRSLGSIPAQGMPMPLPSKLTQPRPAAAAAAAADQDTQQFLETFEEDPDVFHDGSESDACIPAPSGDGVDLATRSPPPPVPAHQGQHGSTHHSPAPMMYMQQAQIPDVAVQQPSSPPPPPQRQDSRSRLLPLTKASVALQTPKKKSKHRLFPLVSREPCYGELESHACYGELESRPSVGSDSDTSRAHDSKPAQGAGGSLLQVPPAPDNVSTSSEPYVYDHLHIRAEYERRMQEEAVHFPPQLETIETAMADPAKDPVSAGDADSWDDGDDYVPVSQAMHVKPSESDDDDDDDDDNEDDNGGHSGGEYIQLKDAPLAALENCPTGVLPLGSSDTATGQTSTHNGPGNGRSNCNSVFSCVSTIAVSMDDFSPSVSALQNISNTRGQSAAAAPDYDVDYDYPKSSRRATVVVSEPSSPSPSCSSLSGSNSMEEIAASLWTRQRVHTMPSPGTGAAKRSLMPSGDTASFVSSLRKGAASANGGQQDKIIEDLLARLSPSRCRSPYHSGIGSSHSISRSPAPEQLSRYGPGVAITRQDATSKTMLTLPLTSGAQRETLMSPRELTERASTSCYDLLQQLN